MPTDRIDITTIRDPLPIRVPAEPPTDVVQLLQAILAAQKRIVSLLEQQALARFRL